MGPRTSMSVDGGDGTEVVEEREAGYRGQVDSAKASWFTERAIPAGLGSLWVIRRR